MRSALFGLAAGVVLGLASPLPAEPAESLPETPRLRVLAWYGVPAEHGDRRADAGAGRGRSLPIPFRDFPRSSRFAALSMRRRPPA